MPVLGRVQIPGELKNLGNIASSIYFIALFFAGFFFLLQIVVGGISWINAGGDPKSLDAARSRITNAVIGLIIVVAAFAITLVITNVFGINIFRENGVIIGN